MMKIELTLRQLKKEMNINKYWHEKHKMPKNPTLEQRIVWHTEHSQNFKCRTSPKKLLPKIKKPN